MNVHSKHDILIIGAGAAGLRAAIEIAEKDSKISIGLISKVYPVRSHTVAAEGGVAAVLDIEDSILEHITDTIEGSDYLADQDAVEFFAKNCKEEILTLDKWGCPWSRRPDGKIATRAFGGMTKNRTVYAADKTGFYILHNLFERTLLHENIAQYNEWFVYKLHLNEKGISGLTAINQNDGTLHHFQSNTIIIATGGAGQIYRNTTNSTINTGDGTALAYNIGAALKDMEFIQFHPTSLPGTGILISEAARGEGGYLLNNKNERFLQNYTGKMELGPRDILTRAIINEFELGNGFEGPHGKYMHLDIKHLGKKYIQEKLPQICELVKNYIDKDPAKSEIPVTPAQHYFMGGIHVNTKGETTIPGLFAVGEASCININGANRLGSNSLAKCLVFGKVTGEQALKHARNCPYKSTLEETKIKDTEKQFTNLFTEKGTENIYQLRDEMKECMEENAGIIRNADSLNHAIKKIQILKEKAKHIKLHQQNAIFNSNLIAALELKNMLDLADTILQSALHRKESRGAHYRKDYPHRDDSNYLSHTIIVKENNEHAISLLPVTITKWQPQPRI
jgi:succinate dehydrogenase/fumarate reductase flavoprotein subunit